MASKLPHRRLPEAPNRRLLEAPSRWLPEAPVKTLLEHCMALASSKSLFNGCLECLLQSGLERLAAWSACQNFA